MMARSWKARDTSRIERWLLAAAVALLALQFCGCGASVYQQHATAAASAKEVLNTAAAAIETACATPAVLADDNPAARAGACLEIVEIHAGAVSAWVTWVTAVLVSATDDSAVEDALTLARPIARFLLDLQDIFGAYGVETPEIPPLLLGLVGVEADQ